MSLRFIREEPVLANTLRKIDFKILPTDIREWGLKWVEDVGRTMRSREMMVGFVASSLYYVVLMCLVSFIPALRREVAEKTLIGRFLEGLGVRV
jgi:hypothetical protein